MLPPGQDSAEDTAPSALTLPVPGPTLTTTSGDGEGGTDDIIVKKFLDTLAEVAFAVASRMKGRADG